MPNAALLIESVAVPSEPDKRSAAGLRAPTIECFVLLPMKTFSHAMLLIIACIPGSCAIYQKYQDMNWRKRLRHRHTTGGP